VTLDATNVTSKGKTTVRLEVGGSSVELTAASATVAAPLVNVNGTGTMVAITAPSIKLG
jgi:hypothetical protein